MTTEIRLLFRHGPATTVSFEGTFSDFMKKLQQEAVKSTELGMPPIAQFSNFAINLSELALAHATATREPVVVEALKAQ